MLCGTRLGALAVVALTAAWLSPAHAASSFSNSLTGFTGDTSQAGTQAALVAAGALALARRSRRVR